MNSLSIFLLDPSVKELLNAAIKAREFSYSPYSKFPVGAALRLANGQIVTGCNIENGAYSPSICAERTALCKAVSEGHRDIKAVAVIAYQEHQFTTPCGVCRQSLMEFAKDDIPIYAAKPAAIRVLVTTLRTLLPFSFTPKKTEDGKI